jgi:hypothetical protein
MLKISVQKVNRAMEGPTVSVIIKNEGNPRIDEGFDLNLEIASRLASMIQEAVRRDGYRGEIEVGDSVGEATWVEFREHALVPHHSVER